MAIWKLEELRQLIENQHGPDQLQKAVPHINSVDWKIRAASYRSYAASTAFSGVFVEGDSHPSSAMKMMFSNGEEASSFSEARFVYEANVIACAQSMHSVSDIISHVILDSLALKGIEEENLSLEAVHKQVPESGLKKRITRILGLVSFRYLQDFVNTSKHVRLVDSQYSLDLTGEEEVPHGVKFRAFECKGRQSYCLDWKARGCTSCRSRIESDSSHTWPASRIERIFSGIRGLWSRFSWKALCTLQRTPTLLLRKGRSMQADNLTGVGVEPSS